MIEATDRYSYRYSWWDSVRVHIAGFILGKGLWRRLAEDLRSIYVKAYLTEQRHD